MRLIYTILLLIVTNFAHSEELIVPPKQVVSIAKALSYPDFPNTLDIIAVIRVESAFKTDAVSKSKKPSIGIMQVQGGSKDLHKSMFGGVGLLRHYYKLLGNRKAAIQAYNIGVGAYKRGQYKTSADNYWHNFTKRRMEYVLYYTTNKL